MPSHVPDKDTAGTRSAASTVAALYVEPNGVYADLPDVAALAYDEWERAERYGEALDELRAAYDEFYESGDKHRLLNAEKLVRDVRYA